MINNKSVTRNSKTSIDIAKTSIDIAKTSLPLNERTYIMDTRLRSQMLGDGSNHVDLKPSIH